MFDCWFSQQLHHNQSLRTVEINGGIIPLLLGTPKVLWLISLSPSAVLAQHFVGLYSKSDEFLSVA